MRTRALTALAAALLVTGLAVAATRGDGGSAPDAEVLGAVETRPTEPAPTTTTTVPVQVAATEPGAAFFTYSDKPQADVAGSATVLTKGPGVHLTVSGFVEGGVARISSSVENATGGPIEFPEGLAVTVEVGRGGSPWTTVVLSDQNVTVLMPGEVGRVSTQLPLDQFGEYDLSAELPYRAP